MIQEAVLRQSCQWQNKYTAVKYEQQRNLSTAFNKGVKPKFKALF
ncbi:hypothetical protein GMES_1371 [Paraglaciecola mesophila KMM 241]|uniref:Uncharacterized protein n=1 Tax=Paraglaciecola mesophila KMM 241 TaxID=1128912 RepID=K6ZJV6_9ALTE|nr:hypothetical protein GMES_1371 [Paraglaciecola mesophila KMM 241]